MSDSPKTKSCSRCGAAFVCGQVEGEEHCWCTKLPHVMPLDFSRDCLCPACLRGQIEARIGAAIAAIDGRSPECQSGCADVDGKKEHGWKK